MPQVYSHSRCSTVVVQMTSRYMFRGRCVGGTSGGVRRCAPLPPPGVDGLTALRALAPWSSCSAGKATANARPLQPRPLHPRLGRLDRIRARTDSGTGMIRVSPERNVEGSFPLVQHMQRSCTVVEQVTRTCASPACTGAARVLLPVQARLVCTDWTLGCLL